MGLQPDLDFFSLVFGKQLIPVNLPLSEDGNDLIETAIKLIYLESRLLQEVGTLGILLWLRLHFNDRLLGNFAQSH
jgi:hypothetical protein